MSAACDMLLADAGTSFTELRLARGAGTAEREAVAARNGAVSASALGCQARLVAFCS
jgi:hypothetical protein